MNQVSKEWMFVTATVHVRSYLQGNIGSSNWGLNLLQEENVIPDIVLLAQHCEVLSIRG